MLTSNSDRNSFSVSFIIKEVGQDSCQLNEEVSQFHAAVLRLPFVSHNLFKIRSRKSFKRVVTCQFIKEVHLRHQFICCCVIMLKARDKRSRLLSLVNLSRKSSQIQASVPYILPCVILLNFQVQSESINTVVTCQFIKEISQFQASVPFHCHVSC